MPLPLSEFLGCTDDNGLRASQTTNTINIFAHTRIGEMVTIPGDEILYPVGHGDGNVEGVFCRLGRQWLPSTNAWARAMASAVTASNSSSASTARRCCAACG